jgi:hypothetical protein
LVKPGIPVIEIDANINDPVFVDKTVEVLFEMIHSAASKAGNPVTKLA